MNTLQEDQERRTAAPAARQSSTSLWPISVAVVAIAAVVAVIVVGHQVDETATKMMGWAERMGDKIATLFQSKVSVENNSFTLAEKEIAELAVVQRTIVSVTKYESSHFTSTALLIVRGVYHVKAGYDLEQGFAMTYDAANKVVTVTLPAPKVLSITPEKQEVYHVQEGMLKGIEPKDTQEAYRQNLEHAKLEASEYGLLKEANARIAQRLNDLLGSDAKVVIAGPPANPEPKL